MSDEKPGKPIEDLKQGLGLIFKAAKGAVEKLPTDKVEGVAKDAAKEIHRAFETVGNEIDKAFGHKGAAEKDEKAPAAEAKKEEEEKKEPQHFDDAYAPEPPAKGPRVG
jgi:hypothetical protein